MCARRVAALPWPVMCELSSTNCSEITAAAQELRTRGWCLISITEQQRDIVKTANSCAAEFFELPLADKRSFRHAAASCSEQCVNVHGQPSARKARAVATAGVGFLSSPAREWFHLAADPATLGQMQWPSEAFEQAILQLLQILESTCTAVLQALDGRSAVSGTHLAAMAADNERWGNPSVLDLFNYSDTHGSQSGGTPRVREYAMGSHTDPGLLTITPCSTVPALELHDNITGDWVDAEHAGNHRLLLFAGDALEDYGCVAAAHRVRCTRETRLSMVYEMRSWEQNLNPSRSFSEALAHGISAKRSSSVLRPDHGRTLPDSEERVTKKRCTKSQEQKLTYVGAAYPRMEAMARPKQT